MNPAQNAYALAKAYLETQSARYDAMTVGLTGEEDNPYVDGTKARAAYIACDMEAAHTLLIKAEDALIEFSGSDLKANLPEAKWNQIAHLFADNGRAALNLGMKQDLIRICVKFNNDWSKSAL